MDYLLAVLTHGRAETLRPTVEAFLRLATPPPTESFIHCDGKVTGVDWPHLTESIGEDCTWVTGSYEQRGFCAATRTLWNDCAASDLPYVFWLEHDFVLRRPLDLRPLAEALEVRQTLAQMALMRGPVNEAEIAAGGLYALRRGQYEPRGLRKGKPETRGEWLEHRAYFTTNPSLMRRRFMAENPWPDDGLPECEGRFGLNLVARGYSFGVWGNGEVWADHVGTRTGFGY